MTIDTQPGRVAPIEMNAGRAGDTVPKYIVSMDRLAQSGIDPADLEIAATAFDEVMQQPEEKREELWKFYMREILPLYHQESAIQAITEETEEVHEAREAKQAKSRHLGNVAWWGSQNDKRFLTQATLCDRTASIDARYKLREQHALERGDSWNEAFQSWPQ